METKSNDELTKNPKLTNKQRRNKRKLKQLKAKKAEKKANKTKFKYEMPKYERKAVYPVDQVLSKCVPPITDKKLSRCDFDGDLIPMNSQRYELFNLKGTKCVHCGLEGEYFAKERVKGVKTFHFNLYGVNQDGQEILFTKDHIVPKSKGGANHISNYQTMCSVCNFEKAAN